MTSADPPEPEPEPAGGSEPKPTAGSKPAPARRFRSSRLSAAQWPAILGLTLLWMLLWDTLSIANTLTGVLVGVVVCVIFPLPPVETHVRLRPAALLRFAVRFALDMAVSSWRINRYILGARPPSSAVLAVRLRNPSDLLLTATSVAVAAVPGSNVLDVHRASGTLYVHIMGADDEAERERARHEMLRLEDRVVRAFGSRADIAALDARRHGRPHGPPGPDGPPSAGRHDEGSGP